MRRAFIAIAFLAVAFTYVIAEEDETVFTYKSNSKEAAARRAAMTREQKLSNFNKWLEVVGIAEHNTKIEIRDTDHGWGVFAKEDIVDGDVVIHVPLQYMMNWRSAIFQDYGDSLTEHESFISDENSLLFHLLAERANPQSGWNPYIDMLPDSYDTPLHWSKSELKELQSSHLAETVTKDLERLKTTYNQKVKKMIKWYPDFFSKDNCDKASYLWGFSTIWSRAFEVPVKENKNAKTLVPLLDLVNLRRDAHNMRGGFNSKKEAFEVVAAQDIAEGEEIFFSSRSKTGAEVLNTYGYFDGTNDAIVPFHLKLPSKAPFREEREEILNKHRFQATDFVQLYDGEEINPDLLAFFRIVLMRIVEFNTVDFYEPLSDETEEKVYDTIVKKLQKKLDSYPTTAEEDKAILEAGGLSPHVEMAVQLRLSEKRVLQKNIDYAQEQLEHYSAKVAKLAEKMGVKKEEL